VVAARRLQLGSQGDGREQIRGGFGFFAGRTPYVWISNQYGNTGVDFTRLSVTNSTVPITFIPIPSTSTPLSRT
jgi:hypothetical protein